MLAQETATAKAKAEGLPAPTFAPILPPENPLPPAAKSAATVETPSVATSANSNEADEEILELSTTTKAMLKPEAQEKLLKRMKGLTPAEREIEERGTQMEVQAAGEIGKRVKEVEDGRRKRRQEGKATMGDTIIGWFGR